MLVNLYSSKTPIAVFSLPIVTAILAVTLFFTPSESTFYFWDWQNEMTLFVHEISWLNYLLTVAIASLTAHWINNVYNAHAFYSKATYLPGFIYVLSLFTLGGLEFSPLLIAHFFLVLGLGQYLKLRRQEGAKTIMFWGSFLMGCAIVFSFFSLAYLLLAMISLAIFRPFVWREWLLIILGFTLPLFYYIAGLYLVKGDFYFKIADPAQPDEYNLGLFQASAFTIIGLVILGSIYKYLSVMRAEVIRFKKQSQVVFHMLWISAAIWASGYFIFEHIYLSYMIPIAFIIGTSFLHAKRSNTTNAIVIIWLIISAANVLIIE